MARRALGALIVSHGCVQTLDCQNSIGPAMGQRQASALQVTATNFVMCTAALQLGEIALAALR